MAGREFNEGDRVGYTADFVRGPGGYLADVADRRATVLDQRGRLVRVRWDDDPERTVSVLESNVCRVGAPAMYA